MGIWKIVAEPGLYRIFLTIKNNLCVRPYRMHKTYSYRVRKQPDDAFEICQDPAIKFSENRESAVVYYAYGEIFLKQFDWVKEYTSKINSFIEAHGGRVLSRSINMEKIEGDRSLPTNVILIEFPSRDAALGFFDDPAYQPLRQLRIDGAISEFTLFPKEDLATMP